MGISSALGSSALLPAGLGFRNLLINGDVSINQRATTATVNTGASYAYGPDRWLGLGTASAGVFTIARSTTVAPDGFRNSLVAQCTTLDSSMASSDNYQIVTHLEGNNVAGLGYGTSWAKQTWLTFWVRSSKTGIYSVSLRNSALNRSFVAEYTINTADTWEFKRIQIVGDTTGTWVVDNGLGLRVAWSLGGGSGVTTSTLNAWQGANVVASTNQVNWMDSATSRFFYLTGVQLEQNNQPTPFEQRPFAVELSLCQRYYEKTYDIATSPGTNTGLGTVYTSQTSDEYGNLCYVVRFNTRKRATPTMTFYTNGGTSGNWTYRRNGVGDTNAAMNWTNDWKGEHGGLVFGAVGAGWTAALISGHWVAESEL